MRGGRIAALTVLGAALTACGAEGASSGVTAPPASSGIDVCSIITSADASAVIGGPVSATRTDQQPDYRAGSCRYRTGGASPRAVEVDVFTGALATLHFQPLAGNTATVPVSGLGDSAYRDSGGRMLVAIKDKVAVEIDLLGLDADPDTLAAAAARLAREVFTRVVE